jgi:hypothetical protein
MGRRDLSADGDASEGEHNVASDGNTEDRGRFEDAGEEIVFDADKYGGIAGAFEDGVVVDAAVGIDEGLDDDGDVAMGFDGLRRYLRVEVAGGDEVREAVVVGLNSDGRGEEPAKAAHEDDGCGEAAGQAKRHGCHGTLPEEQEPAWE